MKTLKPVMLAIFALAVPYGLGSALNGMIMAGRDLPYALIGIGLLCLWGTVSWAAARWLCPWRQVVTIMGGLPLVVILVLVVFWGALPTGIHLAMQFYFLPTIRVASMLNQLVTLIIFFLPNTIHTTVVMVIGSVLMALAAYLGVRISRRKAAAE